MENFSDEQIVNVGTGLDVSIKELAELVKKVVGFNGELVFDTTKPDGTPPRKLLDVSYLNKQGWKYQVNIEQGITLAYEWFLSHQGKLRE